MTSTNLSKRVTFEDGDTAGIWSHDARRVLFAAKGQQLHSGVYETDAGGQGQRHLLVDLGVDFSLIDISRDGRFLLYRWAENPGRDRLWAVLIIGGGKPFPLLEHGTQEFGQFSPDGRWVAFTSQDSGREEVYVAPFHPNLASPTPGSADVHTSWQISASGGRCPRWRGDGKELFFIAADNTLMSVSINHQASKFNASVPAPLFRAGLSNTVVDITAIYDVSRDGKRFIFSFGVLPQSKAPITLVQNWLSDLKQ